MKIFVYKNFKLGSEYGKTVYKFGFNKIKGIRKTHYIIKFICWVLTITTTNSNPPT